MISGISVKVYFTYIIFSKRLDAFYIGHTNNLTARLHRHNSSYETHTSKGAPWLLLWATKKSSKSEAYRLETKLKNLSRQRLVAFMRKFNQDGAGPDALLLLEQWRLAISTIFDSSYCQA